MRTIVKVEMQFLGRYYQFQGSLEDIDVKMTHIIIDRIRCRITQREQAYRRTKGLNHHQKDIDELRRRLKYIRKQSKARVLDGLIRLFPLLKSLTPSRKSQHYSSYQEFLSELNVWIHKSYQDEVLR